MTATPQASPRRRNRRGRGDELRGDIIAATKRLLADSGDSDAVSIRAVADAVGVTPPSLYLHFADKDALLEAVVVDVFAELDAAMVAAARGVDEPLARLCAYGLAYVKFAVEHPEHYRIATMERCLPAGADAGPGVGDMDRVLADSAFTHMNSTVADCMAAGIFASGDPIPVTLELWSAAHGIAALMISKPYLPWGGDKTAFAYRTLRSAALGRALTGVLGDDVTPADAVTWLHLQRRP